MDKESSKNIRERANQYLAEDEVAALNIIKTNIAKYCSSETIYSSQELQGQLKRLSDFIRLRDNKITKISAIEKQQYRTR